MSEAELGIPRDVYLIPVFNNTVKAYGTDIIKKSNLCYKKNGMLHLLYR